ncbi:EF-hand domain-containing protein [Kitasatospora sp. NPDC094015]|uniref:EF-hand domain-containing protein n=1 Tax=Kitasatospora sp. NPDC094015 TaxID=3155205 RepID=UPI00331F01DE
MLTTMGAYKQRTIEFFDLLDASRSGYIDPEDLSLITARSGSDAQLTPVISTFFRELLRAADPNKDGKVGKEEMLAYVERAILGKDADAMPEFLRTLAAGAFQVMDADGNGKVDKAEFERYLKARNVTDPAAANEFAKLDRDRDGSLTAADLRAGIHVFFTEVDRDVPQQWLMALFS